MERTAGSTSSIEPLRVTLGRVIGAHGLRGELRVRLAGGTDNNLRAVSRIWLAREEGDPKAVEARVRAVGSGRRGEARLALEGVDGREAAEALRGRWCGPNAKQLIRWKRASTTSTSSSEAVRGRQGRGARRRGRGSGDRAPDVLSWWTAANGGPRTADSAAREILREVDIAARRNRDRSAAGSARSGTGAGTATGVVLCRCCTGSTWSRSSGAVRAVLRESILGAAGRAGRWRSRCTTCGAGPPTDTNGGGRRTLRRGPGMVMKPEPLVAAIEALAGRRVGTHGASSCCCLPRDGASSSEISPGWSRVPRWCSCAAATRASTSG